MKTLRNIFITISIILLLIGVILGIFQYFLISLIILFISIIGLGLALLANYRLVKAEEFKLIWVPFGDPGRPKFKIANIVDTIISEYDEYGPLYETNSYQYQN